MIGLLKFATSPLGKFLGALAAVAVVVLLIFNAGADYGRKPVAADRDRWKTTAGDYLKASRAWEASYRQDARLRGQERTEAVSALSAYAKACDARVAAARRSAVAIQSIVTKETIYDQAHCPVRSIVGVGELRDALGLAR